MKILALWIMIFTLFQSHANEKSMTYSFFTGKYWGLFVPYPDPNPNKKEYLAVVLYFQNDTLSIISASRTCKTRYNIEDGIIKHHERNGKHFFIRYLFYNQKRNILYYQKPGYWYFIPKKIIYYPLSSDVAQKAIEGFQKNEYHKFESFNIGRNCSNKDYPK